MLKKIFSILLLLMTVVFVLASCDSYGNGKTTTISEPAVTQVNILDYCIIRPDSADSNIINSAINIYNAVLSKAEGCEIEFMTDLNKTDKPQILVGGTSRQVSLQMINSINFDNYVLSLQGKDIVVNAPSAEGINLASQKLILAIKKANYADGKLMISVSDLTGGKVTGWNFDVPNFGAGVPLTVNECGNGALQASVGKTSDKDFENYCKLLTEKNYSEEQSNKMSSNIFSSFVSPDKAKRVFVYYDNYSKITRIICEPYLEYKLKYNEAGNSPVSVIAGNASDRIYYLQLSDKSIVIIDGGQETGGINSDFANAIYNELSEITGTDTIHVSAWILTHPHTDHITGYCSVAKFLPKKFVIDSVLYNFPSKKEMVLASAPNKNEDASTYIKQIEDATAMFEKKPDFIQVHTGQKLNFSGTVFEVTFTHECLYPGVFSSLNSTSAVFKVTIGNQTLIITGDMGDDASKLILKSFGADYLDCDVVSVGHHGWNGGGTVDFYKACSPTVMIWNNTYERWRISLDRGDLKNSQAIYDITGVKHHMWCQGTSRDVVTFPISY